MTHDYFWYIVREYNTLMRSSIEGPNCIDPNVCKGDCCSIKIDVPKILAEEYIRRGYANKDDFIRSDILSFQLRFDFNTGKCFLFDKKINGCSVHNSGIKPPQCWIYPTTFSNPENKKISCKKASGWKITNPKNTTLAKDLLEKYVFLCQLEAKGELRKIKNRLGNKTSTDALKKVESLTKKIKKLAPIQLGGFIDTWDDFEILSSDGISLQLKKFCSQYNNNCKFIPDDFLDCKNICNKISCELVKLLHNELYNYIKRNGPDVEGEYSLLKLFDFIKNREDRT